MKVQTKILTHEYLPELDGLRGISLLIVLFGHAGFSGMPGFYTSVDVFFVISGFLMSRLISKDLQHHRFSFRDFYLRRMKRLAPALLWTLHLSLLPALFLFTPEELRDTARSAFFSGVPVSNLWFYSQSGYLLNHDGDPFLHTWSLSMEEQFYLLWPIFLLGVQLRPRIFLSLIFGVSLIAGQYMLEVDGRASFLLTPFRMFEFVLGAGLFFFPGFKPKNRLTANIIVLCGTLLVAGGFIFLDRASNFPGVLALIPSLGTLFIMASVRQSDALRLFTATPLIALGKSSYSTYLVHYPIMIFYSRFSLNEADTLTKLALIAVSILVGAVLYSLVERRYRLPPHVKDFPIRPFLTRVGLAFIFLGGFAITTDVFNGFPWRFGQKTFAPEKMASERQKYWAGFHRARKNLLSGESDSRSVLIIGNSHAVDLIFMLRFNGAKASLEFIRYSQPCQLFRPKTNTCDATKVINRLEKSESREIFISHSWTLDDPVQMELVIKSLRAHGKTVYVFGPRMRYETDLPAIIIRGEKPEKFEMKAYFQFSERLKKRVQESGGHYIDLLSLQCPKEKCETVIEGFPHYFDSNHLTREGAKLLGRRLKLKYPFLFH